MTPRVFCWGTLQQYQQQQSYAKDVAVFWCPKWREEVNVSQCNDWTEPCMHIHVHIHHVLGGWQFVWYVEHVSCFLQQPSRAGISWKTGTEKTNAQGPIIIAITVHHLYGKLEKKNKQTKKGAQGPSIVIIIIIVFTTYMENPEREKNCA